MAEIESLRNDIANRLGIRIAPGRAPSNESAFRRSIGCEVLKRRGLTRPEIGQVMMLTRRGVDNSLRIVSSRLRSPSFAEYVDNLWTDPREYYLEMVLGDFSFCRAGSLSANTPEPPPVFKPASWLSLALLVRRRVKRRCEVPLSQLRLSFGI